MRDFISLIVYKDTARALAGHECYLTVCGKQVFIQTQTKTKTRRLIPIGTPATEDNLDGPYRLFIEHDTDVFISVSAEELSALLDHSICNTSSGPTLCRNDMPASPLGDDVP